MFGVVPPGRCSSGGRRAGGHVHQEVGQPGAGGSRGFQDEGVPTSIGCPRASDLVGVEQGDVLTDETRADSGFVGKPLLISYPRETGMEGSGSRTAQAEPGHVSANVARYRGSGKVARRCSQRFKTTQRHLLLSPL